MLSKKTFKTVSNIHQTNNTDAKQLQNPIKHSVSKTLIIITIIGIINTLLWLLSTLGSKPILPISYDTSCKITEFMSFYFGWYFQYGIAQIISTLMILLLIYKLIQKRTKIKFSIIGFIVNFIWMIDYLFLRIG